jgi:hypothetical protein
MSYWILQGGKKSNSFSFSAPLLFPFLKEILLSGAQILHLLRTMPVLVQKLLLPFVIFSREKETVRCYRLCITVTFCCNCYKSWNHICTDHLLLLNHNRVNVNGMPILHNLMLDPFKSHNS